jgi:hypothetical protein
VQFQLNTPTIDIQELEETGILSITLDQAHRYFEMVVCTYEGTKYRLSAWNEDLSPLGITFGALHVRDSRVLGELEGVSLVDDVLTLEGDFGDIAIKAAKVSVEKLA